MRWRTAEDLHSQKVTVQIAYIVAKCLYYTYFSRHCAVSCYFKNRNSTVQDFFMLSWVVGRQLSAGVARTGIASIFSCITSCSLVIKANRMLNDIRKLLLFSPFVFKIYYDASAGQFLPLASAEIMHLSDYIYSCS